MEEVSFDSEGLTPEKRAYLLCDEISKGMKKMGVITTAHYDVGIPLIIRMIEAIIKEEREKNG